MSKQLIIPLPKGSCPKCNRKQFIVNERISTYYLTNQEGEIIDSKEDTHICVGQCINCGQTYEMFPTREGFIPLTPLRKLIYEYSSEYIDSHDIEDDIPKLDNPMNKE